MTVTNKEIKQWQGLLFKLTKRYLSTQLTQEDREDVIQAANIALYKALSDYNESLGIPFINYASISIVRAIRRELKKLKYNNIIPFDEGIDYMSDDTTNNIDKQIYNTDMVIRVFKAIHRLNIDIINKKILALKVMGYSNPEIASKLNLKKGQVGDAIYRHKQKLIDKINGGRQ
jgi:RNA polymerase sigma factor (sigma-70 family)